MKNEAQTRKEIVDKNLKSAGWDVNNPMQVVKEFDIRVLLPDDKFLFDKTLNKYYIVKVDDNYLFVILAW